jgi:hypothetical protein
VRGTRSFANKTKCAGDCTELNGIRSFGLDFGYLWPLPLLHFGPRVGGGWARERHVERDGAYIEPGASVDLRLSVFNLGADEAVSNFCV